jgi:sensor histidine kinase regulating citrate/malate metabolism
VAGGVTGVTLSYLTYTERAALAVAHPRSWSLARQLLAWQVLVVLVVVVAGAVAAYLQVARDNREIAEQRVLGIAHAVAAAPDVRAALDDPAPATALQPYAEQVRRDTGTDFVVVMSPAGLRYSHPNPGQIGKRFVGHIGPAAAGRSFTEDYTGTLGPSVRAVVPVRDSGRVRALVSVGIGQSTVARGLRQELPALFAAAAAGLVLAGTGSWLVNRRLRRQTHDLGPAELARMYEFYDAVLHAVREGLLLLDRDGHVQLVNDEALRLLGLPPEAVGARIDGVGLPAALGAALVAGDGRTDEIHLTGDRVLVVSQAPARWADREVGTVVTLRDHTDLQALTGELHSVRGFAEALRSQAHEAANRLHTVVSLVELGRTEQAVAFATAELELAQKLTDRVIAAVEEPVLAALLLGKAAEASERGVELVVAEDIAVPEGSVDARDLVTIVGNLVDNAVDAAASAPAPRRVEVEAQVADGELVLRVADSGAGLDPGHLELAFRRGWSTKSDDRPIGRGLGLALVGQAVHRRGGTVTVTRSGGAVFTVRLPLTRSEVR